MKSAPSESASAETAARSTGYLDEILKMTFGQRHDHECDAVATGEVLTVLPIDRVAEAFALGAVHLRLGQQSQIACGGQRDVFQREADLGARAGLVTATHRGDDGERGVQATADIPGRQHVIDRAGVIRRAGDQRKSGCRVDRVVHTGRAVMAAEHLKMDQVGTFGDERVIDSQDGPAALVTTMPPLSTINRWTSSCPSAERKSTVAERFPLLRPVQ